MAKFKVWSPDACDEEDADEVIAADAEDAATDWARNDHAEEPWESSSVHVREGNGVLRVFEVSAELVVHFSAREEP
jgi:hypothetical protein